MMISVLLWQISMCVKIGEEKRLTWAAWPLDSGVWTGLEPPGWGGCPPWAVLLILKLFTACWLFSLNSAKVFLHDKGFQIYWLVLWLHHARMPHKISNFVDWLLCGKQILGRPPPWYQLDNCSHQFMAILKIKKKSISKLVKRSRG